MSRLDKFEEILKSYDGRASGETVLLNGVSLLKRDYEAIKAVLQPIGLTPGYFHKLNRIDIADERIITFDIYWREQPMKVIKAEIGKLDTLTYLNLSNNLLRELPESIGLLKNLEKMYLINNQLTGLPASMKNLKHLGELSIAGNNFECLPAVLLELPQSEVYIDCRENPMILENDPVLEQLRAKGVKVCIK